MPIQVSFGSFSFVHDLFMSVCVCSGVPTCGVCWVHAPTCAEATEGIEYPPSVFL